MLRSTSIHPLGSPGLRIRIFQRSSLYTLRFARSRNMAGTGSLERATKERAQELKESLEEIRERVSQAVRNHTQYLGSLHSIISSNRHNKFHLLHSDTKKSLLSLYQSISRRRTFWLAMRRLIKPILGRITFRSSLTKQKWCVQCPRFWIITFLSRPQLPQSIRWHFIGTLQSNKCKPLAGMSQGPIVLS